MSSMEKARIVANLYESINEFERMSSFLEENSCKSIKITPQTSFMDCDFIILKKGHPIFDQIKRFVKSQIEQKKQQLKEILGDDSK